MANVAHSSAGGNGQGMGFSERGKTEVAKLRKKGGEYLQNQEERNRFLPGQNCKRLNGKAGKMLERNRNDIDCKEGKASLTDGVMAVELPKGRTLRDIGNPRGGKKERCIVGPEKNNWEIANAEKRLLKDRKKSGETEKTKAGWGQECEKKNNLGKKKRGDPLWLGRPTIMRLSGVRKSERKGGGGVTYDTRGETRR